MTVTIGTKRARAARARYKAKYDAETKRVRSATTRANDDDAVPHESQSAPGLDAGSMARCRWFGHAFGPIVPIPNTKPLVLLQKCGRGVRGELGDPGRCEKWHLVDLHDYAGGTKTEWRELHEVWPRDDPPTESTVEAASEYQESPR